MLHRAILALLLVLAPALAYAQSQGPPSFSELVLTGPGSAGDVLGMCVVAPWTSQCRAQSARSPDTINVLDGQNPAEAGVRDDVAIQAALNKAAAQGGGRVYLPPRSTCYILSAPLTATKVSASYLPTVLYGGGGGTCVKPGATMESLVTATGRFFRVEGINFSNNGGKATNAITLNCGTGQGNTNNFALIERNYFGGFVNGVKNVNCDAWRVEKNWFINQTGWDVWSADNGTASKVVGNYSLGSAGNVLYDRASYNAEGYYVEGNIFLPTSGKGVVIRACLSCFIRGNQIDQANDTALTLDATNWPIADVGVSDNWFGVKSKATNNAVGLSVLNNVTELRIDNTSAVGWKQCGIRLQSGANAVQDVKISGFRGLSNGTAAGTGDFCSVLSGTAGAGVSYTVRDSWLLSSGAGRQSAVEGPGALGTWRNNRVSAAPTKSSASSWSDNYGDDRSASTGKYNGWTSYAVAPTCSSGALGTGYTATGYYDRTRNTVTVRLRLTISNSTALGTCAGLVFMPLPAAIAGGSAANFFGRDVGSNSRYVAGWSASGSNAVVTDMTGATVAASGADVTVSGTYEATP